MNIENTAMLATIRVKRVIEKLDKEEYQILDGERFTERCAKVERVKTQ